MNKKTNQTTENYKMLEDYSSLLTNSHLKKGVRGKYVQSLKDNDSSKVKITGENEDKYVKMKTIKVEVLVNNKGELTVQIPSDLKKGKYQAVLIVEVPNLDTK